MYTHDSISGITTFSKEVLDLRELFVLLTYQCNGNCPFCIEHRIGEKGFLSEENFNKAIDFSIEKGLTSIFLHGGEPTIHPHVVDFAKRAKEVGFLVKMFTNGINFKRVKELDGIADDITISYRDSSSLRYRQSEWESKLTLQILVTEDDFPTLASLKKFVTSVQKTGMNVRVNTLNPVNQYAYDNQCVSYLEEMFLELPDEKIVCASNKVMFDAEGFRVRMSNKSLNPGHIKYSMDPNGEVHCRFQRHLEAIIPNPAIEKQLERAEIKLNRLRSK